MSVGLVYAVHGFLGQAADWNAVRKHLNSHMEFISPDLFTKESSGFNLELLKNRNSKKIFVGYSLGGRQGLWILHHHPLLFDHYVFISTNPGFKENEHEQRQSRWAADSAWAEKISAENWEQFLKEWNQQAVFSVEKKHADENESILKEPERNIEHYDIRKLKDSLLQWSLAKQPDYRNLIGENADKITWIAGSDDKKFSEISENLVKEAYLDSFFKLKGGHRLIFDNPEAVAEIINQL